jgi:hypothetical protein
LRWKGAISGMNPHQSREKYRENMTKDWIAGMRSASHPSPTFSRGWVFRIGAQSQATSVCVLVFHIFP